MKLLQILCIITLVYSFALSQENKKDTLKNNSPKIERTNPFEFYMPDFELYRSLYFTDNKLPGNVDSNSVWLWTSFSISQQNSHGFLNTEDSPHMLANYHEMYLENTKFNMFRTVLGAMQVGAVGYLAYKSISKYGFITPKKK